MAEPPSILVTGASRGIGAAIAEWLGRQGAALSLLARDRKALKAVAKSVRNAGGQALAVDGSVSERADCELAVKTAVDAYGRIDGLINNAGILHPLSALADTDPDDWENNIAVNLIGPYTLMRLAIPFLRLTSGRIVNISSGAAAKAIEAWSAYCTAKAGLTHLTAVAALEEPKITIVALRPGVVDTGMQADIRSHGAGAMTTDKMAYFEALHREGRLEPPWVPARSAAWLALAAPAEWSGRFLEYDDPAIIGPAEAMMGRAPE
ncbi:MAG: SDR family oxidoreductase [Desulfobacterales bacterium]|jgi:NAD(P)-dependent dehydrogenase (short-subunit alcohol dehydrogenase family)